MRLPHCVSFSTVAEPEQHPSRHDDHEFLPPAGAVRIGSGTLAVINGHLDERVYSSDAATRFQLL